MNPQVGELSEESASLGRRGGRSGAIPPPVSSFYTARRWGPGRARRTIWLVGMMGAGKSAVGPRARARGSAGASSTRTPESRPAAGATIAELFAARRRAGLPARASARRSTRWPGGAAVVALGGGAIAQPGAPERLAGAPAAWSICARAPRRCSRGSATRAERPLLAGLGRGGAPRAARELLARARARLRVAPTLVLDTDEREVEALAARARAQAAAARGAGTRRCAAARCRSALGERELSDPDRLRAASASAARASRSPRHTQGALAVAIARRPIGRRYGAARAALAARGAGSAPARVDVPDGERRKSLRAGRRGSTRRSLDADADRGSVRGGARRRRGRRSRRLRRRDLPARRRRSCRCRRRCSRWSTPASAARPAVEPAARARTWSARSTSRASCGSTPPTLRTLPLRERAAGLAEVIKHGAIRDAGALRALERDVERVLALEPRRWRSTCSSGRCADQGRGRGRRTSARPACACS